jgi:hypothetical protein
MWSESVGVENETIESESAWLTTGALAGEDGHESRDEFEYPQDIHALSGPRGSGDRWWSPQPPQPSSEVEEEEIQHLGQALNPEPQGDEAHWRANSGPKRVAVSPRDKTVTPGTPYEGKPRCLGSTQRRKPRRETRRTKDQEWEQARQDAWLREMLTDTSESENEENCGRFAESGRWMAELFRIPQHPTTTSGGECSGQTTLDYS